MANKDLAEKYDKRGIGIDHTNQTITMGVDIDKDGQEDLSFALTIHDPLVWKTIITIIAIMGIVAGVKALLP